MWALFAVLLGTGGLLSQASGGGALFTLSLPVVAQPAARRARRDRAGASCWCSRSSRRCCCRCSRRRSAQTLRRRRRARARRLPVRRRRGVLQPGVPAVDGVQRRLAAAADRALRRRRCWRSSDLFVRGPVALQRLRRDERRSAISAAAGCRGWGCSPARRCRRRCSTAPPQPRAPGFLTRRRCNGRRTVDAYFTLDCCSSPRCSLPRRPASLHAQTAVDPSGHWEGTIQVPNMPVNGRNRSGEEQQRRARRHVHASPQRRQRPAALDRRDREPLGDASRSKAARPATLFKGDALRRRAVDVRQVRAGRLLDPVHADANRRREDRAGAEERRDRQGARRHLERHARRQRRAATAGPDAGESARRHARSAASPTSTKGWKSR